MEIIFRQHIFLHHLLYPSNITSCKKLLFLGWTQSLCGYLTAFDRFQSSEPGYSTDRRALYAWSWFTAGGNKVSGLLGSHVLVPLSDSTWTGLASPLLTDPTSSKAVDLEAAFLCLRQLSEYGSTCAWGTPVRKGRQLFLQMLGSFQSCGRLDFLFYFLWQDFWLWKRKTNFKGLFEKV